MHSRHRRDPSLFELQYFVLDECCLNSVLIFFLVERAIVAMLSATGTRTRVARVRDEYPDQLDYSGDEVRVSVKKKKTLIIKFHHFKALYDASSACGMASAKAESDGCGVRIHAVSQETLFHCHVSQKTAVLMLMDSSVNEREK